MCEQLDQRSAETNKTGKHGEEPDQTAPRPRTRSEDQSNQATHDGDGGEHPAESCPGG